MKACLVEFVPFSHFSVLSFSFESAAAGEFDYHQVSSKPHSAHRTAISLPLQECCQQQDEAFDSSHCAANVLAVLNAIVLPLGYSFGADLLVINLGCTKRLSNNNNNNANEQVSAACSWYRGALLVLYALSNQKAVSNREASLASP